MCYRKIFFWCKIKNIEKDTDSLSTDDDNLFVGEFECEGDMDEEKKSDRKADTTRTPSRRSAKLVLSRNQVANTWMKPLIRNATILEERPS